jgi:hypothetical protein
MAKIFILRIGFSLFSFEVSGPFFFQIVHSHFKISALEDISIYTNEEDTPLTKVFKNIFDKETGSLNFDYEYGNNCNPTIN